MTHDTTDLAQVVHYCISSKLLLHERDWNDVHVADRDAVRLHYPRGWQLVCFQHLGRDDDYDVISDGLLRIRVRGAVVQHVPPPRYRHGRRVHAKRKQTDGVVRRVLWHLKRREFYYVLEINGTESRFRYFDGDLEPVAGTYTDQD